MIFGNLSHSRGQTLTGDFDTEAPQTAPQDALHDPIEGRAFIVLICVAFGISPTWTRSSCFPLRQGAETP